MTGDQGKKYKRASVGGYFGGMGAVWRTGKDHEKARCYEIDYGEKESSPGVKRGSKTLRGAYVRVVVVRL